MAQSATPSKAPLAQNDPFARPSRDAAPVERDVPASHLFLSHSWRDKALARRVERRLCSRGIQVWIDDAQMHPGDSLPASIEAAIRASTHFLPLLTRSAATSKWVCRELGYARRVVGMSIIPLIADPELKTSLLDETLGIALYDTTRFEQALDDLCQRLAPDVSKDTRDKPAMRRRLKALTQEHPLLADLDLSSHEARHPLDALTLDLIDLHSLETFVALTYDLACPQGRKNRKANRIASNTAVLFRRLGVGTYVLEQFITGCDDLYDAHSLFSEMMGEQGHDRTLIPVVQRLFDLCRPPHHTVLKWFAHRNLDRLTVAQQRWVVSHFMPRAEEPIHDALITAFAFMKWMPDAQAVIDLVIRWISAGKLGFEDGTTHQTRAEVFFCCLNAAKEEGLVPLGRMTTEYQYHFRSLARGGTFLEVLAAAEVIVAAKRLKLFCFRDLLEEFCHAPASAEWNFLQLPEATTKAFTDLAYVLQRDEDGTEALIRIYQAPRPSELVAYCKDLSRSSRLSERLSQELGADCVTMAGKAIVIRGPSSTSETLAKKLKSKGCQVVQLKVS